MDAQVQRRIFEPFFTTKANDKGIGLGLAVVHGIMQGHEACIAVQSRPGEGTTISLLFPEAGQTVVATPPEAAPEWVAPVAQPLAQSVSHGRSKHVLYIDDDEALRDSISELLSAFGFQPHCHASAEEFLALFEEGPPSGCIVSDVGSVKQTVIADMLPHIPKGVHFIPAHPVAVKLNPQSPVFDHVVIEYPSQGEMVIIDPCAKNVAAPHYFERLRVA